MTDPINYYQYKWTPIKLNSARPFLIDTIELSQCSALQKDMTEDEIIKQIGLICKESVEKLLEAEKNKRRENGLGEMDMVGFFFFFFNYG